MNVADQIGTDESWVQVVHNGLVRELARQCRPYGEQMLEDGSLAVTQLTRSKHLWHRDVRCVMPGTLKFDGGPAVAVQPFEFQTRDPVDLRRAWTRRTFSTAMYLYITHTSLTYGGEVEILFQQGAGTPIDRRDLGFAIAADRIIRVRITDVGHNQVREDAAVSMLFATDFRAP